MTDITAKKTLFVRSESEQIDHTGGGGGGQGVLST